jgi:hypothetical protein
MPAWGWVLIGVGIFVILVCGGTIAGLTYLGKQVSNTFSQIGSSVISGDNGGFGSLITTGTVLSFYDDLNSGNYTTAAEMLSGDLANKYTTGELRTKWEALVAKEGSITTGLPHEESVTGGTSIVTQELTTDSGKSYTIRLTLKSSESFLWLITDASPALIPEP